MKKWSHIACVLMLLAPLASVSAKTIPVSTQTLPQFNGIVVSGDGIQVNLRGTQRHSSIQVTGANPAFSFYVQNDTLWIQAHYEDTTKPIPLINVTVRGNNIRDLRVMGDSRIDAQIVDKTPLSLVTEEGDITLKGIVNLRHIMQEQGGNISVYWVNSKELQIHSEGNGSIRLAGIVNTLHARINGTSKLDAPYLRTQTAFIQTTDQANAYVIALNMLDAFANDTSNIFYFKAPKHLVSATRDYGNVLQLAFWN